MEMDPLKMIFLLKVEIFHCYVSLPESICFRLSPKKMKISEARGGNPTKPVMVHSHTPCPGAYTATARILESGRFFGAEGLVQPAFLRFNHFDASSGSFFVEAALCGR